MPILGGGGGGGDWFQPLDVSVNKRCNNFVRSSYNDWYADQVQLALNAGIAPTDVKIKQPISVIKPLHAEWLIKMYADLKSTDGTECILRGVASSSINDAIENADDIFKESDDPFV